MEKETNRGIFSIHGVKVFFKTYNNQTSMDIDVHLLAKGVYVVKIQTDKGYEVKKLVIR